MVLNAILLILLYGFIIVACTAMVIGKDEN